jgi:hypothetical protein
VVVDLGPYLARVTRRGLLHGLAGTDCIGDPGAQAGGV